MNSYDPDKYKYSNRDRTQDVEINLGDIYYSINYLPPAYDSTQTLKTKIASISERDSEYSTLELLDEAVSLLSDNSLELENIGIKLNNTKNLLIEFDTDAKYFFQFVDTGVLDETLHYTTTPIFDQTEYNRFYTYGNSQIETSGCGLCAVTAAAGWMLGYFMAPGQYNTQVADSSHLEAKMIHAGEIQGVEVTPIELGNDTSTYDQISNYIDEGAMVIALVPSATGANTSDHYVLITGTADGENVNIIDSYKNKMTGSHVVYSSTNPNEEGDVPIRTRVYVVNPNANIGDAEVAHTTISIGKEAMDQISMANEQVNSETGKVESVELNPNSQNVQSYNKAVEEYNNREQNTQLPENTPRENVGYDPETKQMTTTNPETRNI